METDREREMKPFGVAIIGTGWIARKMAHTLRDMEGVSFRAVVSRRRETAEAFAAEWGAGRAYDSVDAMLADPGVELVYIATPHPFHGADALRCVEAGVPVLCEKPFTVNAREAEQVLALAARKGVYVAEAIWTRYMPLTRTMQQIVERGDIGTPRMVTANLGYPNAAMERMWNPALAGGALLDLGVYTLNFAAMIFPGDPETITSTCTRLPSGVDGQNSIAFSYPGGEMALLSSSLTAKTDRQGTVAGEKGFLVVENINNPESITVYDFDYRPVARYDAPAQITGFEYQVGAAIDAIRAGEIETPFMPHAETLRVMRLMDGVRAGWGLKYPFE